MSEKVVMAAYRARHGRFEELCSIVKEKRDFMVGAGYYTERAPYLLVSEEDPDLLIEIFEWKSLEAIDNAHKDPSVHEIWGRMDGICSEVGSRPETFPGASVSFPLYDNLV